MEKSKKNNKRRGTFIPDSRVAQKRQFFLICTTFGSDFRVG